MTPQDITLLLGAFGIFIGILGGGDKWLLSHIAANAVASEVREEKARNAMGKLGIVPALLLVKALLFSGLQDRILYVSLGVAVYAAAAAWNLSVVLRGRA